MDTPSTIKIKLVNPQNLQQMCNEKIMRCILFVLMVCFLTYITASDVLTLAACMKRHVDIEPRILEEIFIPYDDPIMDAVFDSTNVSGVTFAF